MKKKRILSMLLAASLALSSLSFTVLAESADEATLPQNEWVAASGPKELNVIRIDETADANAPKTDVYYRLYDFKNTAGADEVTYNLASSPFTTGKTYRMYVYMRSLAHVNEAAYNDYRTYADVDNNMTVRINYIGSEKAIANITDEWTLYSADFKASAGAKNFSFQRHYWGSEDTVPFDIGGIYFVELDASGNEVGSPIIGAGTYGSSAGTSLLAVNKSGEVFDRIEVPTEKGTANVTGTNNPEMQLTQTNTVPVTDGFGFTVQLTGNDDIILKPGKYNFSGDFRLGWFDHKKLVLNDRLNIIVSDNNTAPLQAYFGSTLLGSASLNPNTWTNISKSFEITKETPMSKITVEVGAIVPLDYKNLTLELIEFDSGSGEDIGKVTPSPESYICIRGRDHNEDSFAYSDTTKAYDPSKTYEISFKARTLPFVAGDATVSNRPATIRVIASGTLLLYSQLLTSDWTEITLTASNYKGEFNITGSSKGYSFAPIDIKDLVITEKGTTQNLAVNADAPFENGAGWKIHTNVGNGVKNFMIQSSGTEAFFRIPKPSSGITSVTYASDEIIEPGIYYVSGDFRLNEIIDYGKYVTLNSSVLASDGNSANLSANINGTALRTLNSASEVSITPEAYTSVTFVLKLTEAAKKSDIEFKLDGAYSLDFKNITVENKNSEFDTSLIPGDGTFISRVRADSEPYIRADGRDYFSDTVVYRDTVTEYDPSKTYEISFMARTDEYIPAPDPIGTKPATFRIAMTDGGGYFVRTLTLTSEFTACGPYELTGFSGSLAFWGSPLGYGVAPIDIKDLVITEKGTSENLAKNPISLFTDGAGWEAGTSGGLGIKEFFVSSVNEENYLAVPASSVAGEATSFSFASDEVLLPGIYHISGSFKLNEPIDYSKYAFDSGSLYITSNENTESLSVSVNGNTLKTLDGEESVVINPEAWTTHTFKLTVGSGDTVRMSDVSFIFGDAINVGVKNIAITDGSALYNSNYTDSSGDYAAVIDESGEEPYISFGGRDSNFDRLVYTAGNIPTGTYTITFKARTKPFIAGDPSTVGSNPSKIRAYASTATGGENTLMLYRQDLTAEWTEICATVTDFTGTFYICGTSAGCGFAPFDVKDLTIVKEGTQENVASNTVSPSDGVSGWSALEQGGTLKALTVTSDGGSVYNRVFAPEDGVTEIHVSGLGTLTSGIYSITGRFRLAAAGAIDFTKYETNGDVLTADGNMILANLGASVNGIPLVIANGVKTVEVSDSWTEVTFILDTAADIDVQDLMFSLDSAAALDFSDIEIILAEKKLTAENINLSIVMTLLALKQKELDKLGLNAPWGASDSGTADVINKILAKENESAVSNSYIRLGGRDNCDDRLIYENTGKTLEAGAYKLSFRARSADVVNVPLSITGITSVRVMLGSSQVIYLASEKTGIFNGSDTVLTSDWVEYSYIINLANEYPFKLMFRGSVYGNSVVPFEIDSLSLVKLDPASKRPIDGQNLAVDSDSIRADSASAGWYAEDAGGQLYTLTASEESESEFIRVTADESGNAAVRNTGSRKLEPGKYFVTARVRVGALDYNKYSIKNSAVLEADANKASLRAYLAGKELLSVDGRTSETVGAEWKEVTFVVEVTEPVSPKKLRLVASGASVIDYDYINLDTKINKIDMDAIDPENGTGLPPVVPGNENDLLDGATSKEILPYWTAAGQTLEAREDENGVYFAVSGIESNLLGITYKPGFKVKAGTYRFTAQMRTSNEGEMSIVRISVGDDISSSMIDNTWRTVSITLTVSKTSDFELKIYGGPMKNNTKDYEFRNARFMEVNYVPTEENLYENGEFNNEATVSGEWKMGYGSGDITVNTDEDGNKYLTSSERKDSDAPIVLSLVYAAVPGNVYTVSYDVRTSSEGEAMNIRSAIGSKIDALSLLTEGYAITDEWTHVEHTFIPLSTMGLNLWISGVGDSTSFDIDNVSIVKNEDVSAAIPEDGKYYLNGNFENPENALDGWSIAEGTGKIGIGSENGNSYLTVKERIESYTPVNLSTGYPAIVGRTYRVAYDARTSDEGETMYGRTAFVLGGTTYELKILEGFAEDRTYLSSLTDEWQHYEFTYTVENPGEIVLQLRGGPRGDPDNKNFDIDNLVIELVD